MKIKKFTSAVAFMLGCRKKTRAILEGSRMLGFKTGVEAWWSKWLAWKINIIKERIIKNKNIDLTSKSTSPAPRKRAKPGSFFPTVQMMWACDPGSFSRLSKTVKLLMSLLTSTWV